MTKRVVITGDTNPLRKELRETFRCRWSKAKGLPGSGETRARTVASIGIHRISDMSNFRPR